MLPCGTEQVGVQGGGVQQRGRANGALEGMGAQLFNFSDEARRVFQECVDGYCKRELDCVMADERRKHERLPAKLTIRFSSPKAFLQQYSQNISKGGLFIQAEKLLPPNTEVGLVLHLPLTKREMEVKARVAHVRPDATDEGPRGMGVEFLDLSEETRKVIDAYVGVLKEKEAKGRI